MTVAHAGSLAAGMRLVTANGRQGTIGGLLGSGGQGEVYRVTVDGLALALKWYHAHYIALDSGLRQRLEASLRRGAPTDRFLWPIDMVTIPGTPSFGYLMPLRAAHFVSIRDLIAPLPRRLSLTLAERASICRQLADSFLELHAAGFCYQDINFGNIFIDPATADILICDNDNVNVDGAPASIYGTRKFMAPEVVRRDALPSSRTDLFSLAVLFFYTLFAWHPLDGALEHAVGIMDAATELQLYGTEPRFIFATDDSSNGPVAGFHDALVLRWRALPAPLRSLFERAFGDGLRDPAARVMETEWQPALAALVESLITCRHCGFEHVVASRATTGCLSCSEALDLPLTLQLGSRTIVLAEGRSFALDVRNRSRRLDARVERHPHRPDLIGLRNLSVATWQVVTPDGKIHSVDPGKTLRLLEGARVDFGGIVGPIVGPSSREAAA